MAAIGEVLVVKKGDSLSKEYVVKDKTHYVRQDVSMRKASGLFDFSQLVVAFRPSSVCFVELHASNYVRHCVRRTTLLSLTLRLLTAHPTPFPADMR